MDIEWPHELVLQNSTQLLIRHLRSPRTEKDSPVAPAKAQTIQVQDPFGGQRSAVASCKAPFGHETFPLRTVGGAVWRTVPWTTWELLFRSPPHQASHCLTPPRPGLSVAALWPPFLAQVGLAESQGTFLQQQGLASKSAVPCKSFTHK